MELFDQIKVVVDLQNQALSSGVNLGRNESAARIAFLEERNAKLLKALKDAANAIEAHLLKLSFQDEKLDKILKALKEKGE